eukprot:480847-Prymnesium_polylepis.1
MLATPCHGTLRNSTKTRARATCTAVSAGGAENLTSHYVMLLGLYRLFYLFNWIYRYATEDNYMQVIVWVSGAPPPPRGARVVCRARQ